jgi:hypothetical protein
MTVSAFKEPEQQLHRQGTEAQPRSCQARLLANDVALTPLMETILDFAQPPIVSITAISCSKHQIFLPKDAASSELDERALDTTLCSITYLITVSKMARRLARPNT